MSRITIPSIPSSEDSSIRRALKLLVDAINAQQGNIQSAEAAISSVTSAVREVGDSINWPIPAARTNLQAFGLYNQIALTWDIGETDGLAHIEIWRSDDDNLGNASLVGTTTAAVYADSPPDQALSATYYYWIRAVNRNPVPDYSPFNATAGTAASTADDPGYILDVLSGEITEGQLFTNLNDRIDLIDTPTTGLVDTTTGLQSQINDISGSLATDVYIQDSPPVAGVGGVPDPIPDNARWYDSDDNNHPYIWQNSTWNDLADPRIGANASDIDALEATVNDPSTGVAASATAIDSLEAIVVTGADSNTALAQRATNLETTVNDPTNGVTATASALDAVETLTSDGTDGNVALSGRVSTLDSQVNDSVTGLPAAHAAVNSEAIARADGDTALSGRVDTIDSQINDSVTGLPAAHAAVTTEQSARVSGDDALAQDITTLSTTVNGNTTAIQTKAEVSDMNAIYEVKIDANGRVSGFGLVSTDTASEFGILADRFWIADPANPEVAQPVPFVVDGGTVYINVAMIKDATITNAKIQSVAADKIIAGTITAALEIITPLLKNAATGATATLDMSAVNPYLKMVAGSAYTQVSAGKFVCNLGGVNIFEFDGTNVTIRDSDGTVLLQSGGNIDIGRVSGAGALALLDSLDYSAVAGVKPPSNADATASSPQSPGWLTSGVPWSGNKITSANQATYISSLIVGNAWIGDLAVSTLKIQANAVTLPMSYTNSGSMSSGTAASLVMDSGGQPVWVQFSAVGYATAQGDNIESGDVPAETSLTAVVRRDGVAMYTRVIAYAYAPGPFRVTMNGTSLISFLDSSPGAGAHTYSVTVSYTGESANVSYRSLFCQGMKR